MQTRTIINAAIAILFRSTSIISALVIFLISSYLYGPEGRGVTSFLTAFFAAAGLALSFGIGRAVYQKVTTKPELTSEFYLATTRFVNLLSLLFLMVSLIIYGISTFRLSTIGTVEPIMFLFFIGYFPYAVWQGISNYFYTAAGKTNLHDRLTLFTRIGQIFILSLAFPLRIDFRVFVFMYGFTSYLIYVVESKALLLKQKPKNTWSQSFRLLYSIRKDFRWTYIESLAQTLAPFAVFLLGLFVTSEVFGYYSFAIQIISTLYFPFWVLSIKSQEKLSKCNLEDRRSIIKRNFLVVAPVSIVLMIAALFIELVLPLAGLASFNASMSVLKYMLPTVPLVGLYYIFNAIWVAAHRPKFSSILTICGGLTNIFCIVLLAEQFGTFAGVIGCYVTYLLYLVANIFYLRKNWHNLFI